MTINHQSLAVSFTIKEQLQSQSTKTLLQGQKTRFRRQIMKITEDWMSVIIAFALMILAMVGLINPDWVAF